MCRFSRRDADRSTASGGAVLHQPAELQREYSGHAQRRFHTGAAQHFAGIQEGDVSHEQNKYTTGTELLHTSRNNTALFFIIKDVNCFVFSLSLSHKENF